jgi:hypothetical protein
VCKRKETDREEIGLMRVTCQVSSQLKGAIDLVCKSGELETAHDSKQGKVNLVRVTAKSAASEFGSL